MNTKTEYENTLFTISNSLDIYKTFYLKQHLHEPLQAHDMDDLKQDLYILMMTLQKDNRCLQADDIENYCYRCYKNLVIKFAKQNSIRVKTMDSITEHDLAMLFFERVLTEPDYNERDDKTPYFELFYLQHLTQIEQKVFVLRATHSYKEIERLLDYYDYKIDSYKKIFSRAKKKVLDKYPILGQKWGWRKIFKNF